MGDRGEALAEGGELLQQQLGLGVERERQDQAGDRGDVGGRVEGRDQGREPVGVDHDVVVGEGHDLATGDRQPGVARTRQAGHRLLDVADARVAADRFPGSRLRARTVLHHHDLERAVARGLQRVEAAHQLLGLGAGRHDDRDQRSGIRQRTRLQLDALQRLLGRRQHVEGPEQRPVDGDDHRADRRVGPAQDDERRPVGAGRRRSCRGRDRPAGRRRRRRRRPARSPRPCRRSGSRRRRAGASCAGSRQAAAQAAHGAVGNRARTIAGTDGRHAVARQDRPQAQRRRRRPSRSSARSRTDRRPGATARP